MKYTCLLPINDLPICVYTTENIIGSSSIVLEMVLNPPQDVSHTLLGGLVLLFSWGSSTKNGQEFVGYKLLRTHVTFSRFS